MHLALVTTPTTFLRRQLVQGGFRLFLRFREVDHTLTACRSYPSPFPNKAPFTKEGLRDIHHMEPLPAFREVYLFKPDKHQNLMLETYQIQNKK